jgi:hypothetical protein
MSGSPPVLNQGFHGRNYCPGLQALTAVARGGHARATMWDGRPRPSVSGPDKVCSDQRGAERPGALQIVSKTSMGVRFSFVR